MEPLDPELRRLVHDGMVQAVPSQEVEDRVLLGLLARLPQGGPSGGEGSRAPVPGEGAATAGPAVATATSKPWLWVVLGVTAMAGAVAVGGALEPERPPAAAQQDVRAPRAATRTPSASERPAEPLEPSSAPSVEVEPRASSLSSSTAGARARPSASRRPASEAGVDRGTEPAPALTTPTPDDLAAEIQQIAAADRALARGDARRALALARAHAVAHPQGQLGVEREAIEHAARCQLAEPGAAEAAAAFLRAHADAPAAAKVRTRCAATP